MEEGQIVLKSTSNPREGWEKSFKQMHEDGDDVFDDDDISEEWTKNMVVR